MPADTSSPALIRAVRAGCDSYTRSQFKMECDYPECDCSHLPRIVGRVIAALAETGIDDPRSIIDGLREDFTRLLEFWPPSKRGSRCQAILDQMQMRLDVGKDND